MDSVYLRFKEEVSAFCYCQLKDLTVTLRRQRASEARIAYDCIFRVNGAAARLPVDSPSHVVDL